MIRNPFRRSAAEYVARENELPTTGAGEFAPGQPWTAEQGVREVRHYTMRRPEADRRERDVLTGGLLWAAGLIIAAGLAGSAYVGYEAQRAFAYAHNHGDHWRAVITAALPDAGWAAMAMVALVAALRGWSSLRARVGVVLFFALSLGAQLMYAPRTPEGVLVAVIAPVGMAWMLESFVVEVRRWARGRRRDLAHIDEAPIITGLLRGLAALPRLAGRLALWLVRLCMDRRSTWAGLREWVLDEAPIAPGRTAASQRAEAAEAGQADAARLVEVERERAELEMTSMREEAAERLRQLATEHEQRRTSDRQATQVYIEQLQADARARQEQLETSVARLENRLAELREENAALAERTTGRARLIAAYEALGRSGDRRYGDRSAVAEVARELAPRVGLASTGTARAYLSDYLAEADVANGPLASGEMSQAAAMIGPNGVNGS